MVVNIIANWCCTPFGRQLMLHAKMLKENETEEAIGFFVSFLSFMAFQAGPPPGYAYAHCSECERAQRT